ncbi:MAG: cation transporter [Acidobacteria bacterium]|nr:cation transporter [Acidobacteriota bacterium]
MKGEKWAAGGAVLAAVGASLCCIGPLISVILGLGIFGAAAAFESARPYLLGAAALFLAYGFYRVYFRRPATCEPGSACAVKPVSRAGKAGLWIAAAAVLSFALSPYYAGALARRMTAKPAAPESATSPATSARAASSRAEFKVGGMTCAGCEETIKLALEKTPGVRRAAVSYDRGAAEVEYDPGATSPEVLRDVISQTGYPAELKR